MWRGTFGSYKSKRLQCTQILLNNVWILNRPTINHSLFLCFYRYDSIFHILTNQSNTYHLIGLTIFRIAKMCSQSSSTKFTMRDIVVLKKCELWLIWRIFQEGSPLPMILSLWHSPLVTRTIGTTTMVCFIYKLFKS